MLPHLFVYGTLHPAASDSAGRHARNRLGRESTLIGTAATTGRLYDLVQYPGLWAGNGGLGELKGEVTGCVMELAKPSMTFAWLDLYEGNEYERQRRPVALAAGGTVVAWVYMLRRKPSARIIATGDWLDVAGRRRSTALRHRASSLPRRRRRSRI